MQDKERKSVCEVYGLNDAVYSGFSPTLPYDPLKPSCNPLTLPYNPLELIAAIDDKPTPAMIIGYDFYERVDDAPPIKPYRNRVVDGVPRIKPFSTHVTVTILPGFGITPYRVTLGPKCSVEKYDGKRFVALHPELAEEAAIYNDMDSLEWWQKLFHPALRKRTEGMVTDESWRYIDNCMSIHLTEFGLHRVMNVIRKYIENTPKYQALALWDENCKTFAAATVRGADVSPPPWWNMTRYPMFDARLLDIFARNDMRRSGDWLLQSRAATRCFNENLQLRGAIGHYAESRPRQLAYA